MNYFFSGIGVYVGLFILIFVMAAAGTLIWVNAVRPLQLAGERNVDIQSRQNVAAIQTSLRQDMQDYVRQSNCPPCQQQDVMHMHQMADQLPDSSFIPNDIYQFLETHS